MRESLAREHFLPHVNSEFRVGSDAGSPVVELVEVSALRSARRNQTFSLVFRGPGNIYLPQATYRLLHADLGELALFIVPIGQDERGLYYEAIFNNLIPGELL